MIGDRLNDNGAKVLVEPLLQHHDCQAGSHPLSHAQQRFQVGAGDSKTNPGDHVRIIHRLRGVLDLDALESAFQELIREHHCLRTCFESDGTSIRQRVVAPWRFKIDRRSILGGSQEEIDACIAAFVEEPFDVASGRMFRVLLIDVDKDERILAMVSHHLVIDGWSVSLILEELTALYDQFSKDRFRERETKIGKFSEYVEHMAAWEQSDDCRAELEQWKKEIEPGLAATVLPADKSRHDARITTFGEINRTITGELAQHLAERGRQWRTGAIQIIDAAISCLLARATGDSSITTGLALTNRPQAEFERMVANCANESIIHVKVDVKQAYVAVLEQMNASVRNAKLLLNTPFETLAKSLELQRIGKRRLALPIFFSLYDLLREGTLRFDDVIVERIPDSHVNPFQEIGIQAVVEPGTLRFAVDFDETLFAKQRIEALLDTLILMLEKVLEDPETIVADLPFDSSLAQGVEEDAVLAPSESIEHVEPQTLVETRLAEIWTELLDVHPIGRFDDFWDLGGSSLLAIRLIDRVHEVFGAQLGIDALMSGPSLREVASRIERSGKRLKIDRSVWISSDRDQPKLFCIPGIGGLAAFTFRNIGSFLEGSVSLVGLQMRGLDGLEEPDDRIEKMASTMLDEMRAIQPEGPYHLCGNSFGGSIAMEVARLIQVSGDEIPSLLLLDTYPPNFIRLHRRLLRTFKKRISGDGRSEGAPERDEFDPIMPEAALAKIGGLVNAIENSLATTKAASWMYTPDRYVGNMDLVLSTSRVDAKSINENRFVIEWGKHVDGKLTLHPILVQHLQLVRDGSEEISEVIRSIVLDDDGGTR